MEALFGFNLGVELGQALIVMIVFPLLYALRKWKRPAHLWVHRALGSGLVLAGAYWFVLRAVN